MKQLDLRNESTASRKNCQYPSLVNFPEKINVFNPKQKFTSYLNHSMIAAELLDGETDLYQGSRTEQSYVLWDDGDILPITKGDEALILNHMSTPGGVEDEEEITVEGELQKAELCERFYVSLTGEFTGDQYYKKVPCSKWFCETCGDTRNEKYQLKQGTIHKDRKKSVYARLTSGQFRNFSDDLKDILNKTCVLQMVFTVAEQDRHLFKSKEGLNRLSNSVRRIMKTEYPGEGQQAFIHVVGDLYRWVDSSNAKEEEILKRNKEGRVLRKSRPNELGFNPHINVFIFLARAQVGGKDVQYRVPVTKLNRIKTRYHAALRAHGCKSSVVDVNVNFEYQSIIKKLHKIKYMTKPIEQGFLQAWQENGMEDMVEFAVLEMKGFRFLRYWEELSNSKYKDWFMKITGRTIITDLVTEEEQIAGEPLKKTGMISAAQVNRMINMEQPIAGKVMVEIAPGFYRLTDIKNLKKQEE